MIGKWLLCFVLPSLLFVGLVNSLIYFWYKKNPQKYDKTSAILVREKEKRSSSIQIWEYMWKERIYHVKLYPDKEGRVFSYLKSYDPVDRRDREPENVIISEDGKSLILVNSKSGRVWGQDRRVTDIIRSCSVIIGILIPAIILFVMLCGSHGWNSRFQWMHCLRCLRQTYPCCFEKAVT